MGAKNGGPVWTGDGTQVTRFALIPVEGDGQRRRRPKGFLSSQWAAGIAPRLRTGRLTTGGTAIPDQGSCGLPAPPPKGGIEIARVSG